jgi:hypothetical protein
MTRRGVLGRVADVTGVVGSFVSDAEGELLLAAMPAEFREPELRRTSSRLASMVRCATLCGVDVEACDLNVGPCRLLVARFRSGTLCVLADPTASRRAVRMAMQLAVSELPSVIAAGERAIDLSDEDEATVRYQRESEPLAL